ncbi:hypothetical protein AKJ16_DCAP24129 [Drosera capensis]
MTGQFTEKEVNPTGYVDEQFVQLEELQDETNPNFVEEVTTLFYKDSARLLANIDQAMDRTPLDFANYSDSDSQEVSMTISRSRNKKQGETKSVAGEQGQICFRQLRFPSSNSPNEWNLALPFRINHRGELGSPVVFDVWDEVVGGWVPYPAPFRLLGDEAIDLAK